MGHGHIEKYTAPDTSRGCGRMVVGSIGVGVGGVGGGGGRSLGLLAVVAQWAASVVVLPGGNTETEESQHVGRVPGTAVRAQVQVQACVGDIDEVEQERTYTCTSNREQRSTLSTQV